MVYFIQVGDAGLVKIGVSSNPLVRLASLQTSHSDELRLIGTMPGKRSKERELHDRFASLRVRGEWFRPDMCILEMAWYGGHIPAPIKPLGSYKYDAKFTERPMGVPALDTMLVIAGGLCKLQAGPLGTNDADVNKRRRL